MAAVKEEPVDDEDEPFSDPALVPPCVVLEKLEELLTHGRIMLRYQRPTEKDWGVNGKLGREWRCFKATADIVCQFSDDMLWTTDNREGWADAELETLERLHQEALKFPASSAIQPSSFQPRKCRRAVFDYHKRKHKEACSAKAKDAAKAPAKATETRVAAGKAKAAIVAKPKQIVAKKSEVPAPVANVQAAIRAKPKSIGAETGVLVPKAKVHAAKGAPSPHAAVANNREAFEAFLEKLQATLPEIYDDFLMAESEGAAKDELEAMLEQSADLLDDFRKLESKTSQAVTAAQFLAAAKQELLEANQKDIYKKLIAAVSKGSDQVVIGILSGHPSLVDLFRRLRQSKSSAISSAKAAATPSPEQKAIPSPPRKPVAKALDLEAEILRPIRERGGDSATQLVNLVLERRGAPANLRLTALRYARTQMTPETSFRKLVILRGPPGCGKSQWALEQLRIETGILQEEEHVARLMHICTADDVHTSFKEGAEVFAFNGDREEAAHARNDARVKLAMEVGIQPLFVDGCHTQLWEMTSTVRLAKKAGYEIVIVDPVEICAEWDKLDAIQVRNTAEGRDASKIASTNAVQASLYHFERLDEVGEEAEKVVLSCVPGVARSGHIPPPLDVADSNSGGVKRSAPTTVDTGGCKAIRLSSDGDSAVEVGLGAESRVASNLFKSLLKKST